MAVEMPTAHGLKMNQVLVQDVIAVNVGMDD